MRILDLAMAAVLFAAATLTCVQLLRDGRKTTEAPAARRELPSATSTPPVRQRLVLSWDGPPAAEPRRQGDLAPRQCGFRTGIRICILDRDHVGQHDDGLGLARLRGQL